MPSTVIGGAMLPHAPQSFTMPETEDRATVEKVRAVASEIGAKLKAMQPDLWIIFSNDHAEQFFLNVAPPFTIHVGGEAFGEFAGRKFRWRVPSEIGFELVRELYRQNFDPAFTSTARIDYAIGINTYWCNALRLLHATHAAFGATAPLPPASLPGLCADRSNVLPFTLATSQGRTL